MGLGGGGVGGPFLFPSRHVKHLPIMQLKGQAQGIDIFWQVYELSFESSGCPRTFLHKLLMTNRNLTTSVEVAQATLGICRGQYIYLADF